MSAWRITPVRGIVGERALEVLCRERAAIGDDDDPAWIERPIPDTTAAMDAGPQRAAGGVEQRLEDRPHTGR
jgi:hypothetical protein